MPIVLKEVVVVVVVDDGCEVVGVKEVGSAKECRTLLNRGAKIE